MKKTTLFAALCIVLFGCKKTTCPAPSLQNTSWYKTNDTISFKGDIITMSIPDMTVTYNFYTYADTLCVAGVKYGYAVNGNTLTLNSGKVVSYFIRLQK